MDWTYSCSDINTTPNSTRVDNERRSDTLISKSMIVMSMRRIMRSSRAKYPVDVGIFSNRNDGAPCWTKLYTKARFLSGSGTRWDVPTSVVRLDLGDIGGIRFNHKDSVLAIRFKKSMQDAMRIKVLT
jgi:hypothetical protein